MKKLTKILSVIAILAILVVSLSVFVSCNQQPVQEDATFTLEVRKYNGQNDDFSVKLDGELLASKQIAIKAGQVHISEAFEAAATKEGELFKISFDGTDYLLFSNNWFVSNGSLSKEPNYIADDFTYSYQAKDGVMSNGATLDAIDSLKVFTIVIDGWDGETGTTKPYAG
ncbi:MAG: hypothetical protein K5923_00010 [Clostridia bacterium]|nr:hypothetical protein [Clostridia bacterium]